MRRFGDPLEPHVVFVITEPKLFITNQQKGRQRMKRPKRESNLKWLMKLILWLFVLTAAVFIVTFIFTIIVAIKRFMF